MERRDSLAGYLFIAPQMIGITVFVLIPLGLVFWYSLHEWNVLAQTFRFQGLGNYQTLLASCSRTMAASMPCSPPSASRAPTGFATPQPR